MPSDINPVKIPTAKAKIVELIAATQGGEGFISHQHSVFVAIKRDTLSHRVNKAEKKQRIGILLRLRLYEHRMLISNFDGHRDGDLSTEKG